MISNSILLKIHPNGPHGPTGRSVLVIAMAEPNFGPEDAQEIISVQAAIAKNGTAIHNFVVIIQLSYIRLKIFLSPVRIFVLLIIKQDVPVGQIGLLAQDLVVAASNLEHEIAPV